MKKILRCTLVVLCSNNSRNEILKGFLQYNVTIVSAWYTKLMGSNCLPILWWTIQWLYDSFDMLQAEVSWKGKLMENLSMTRHVNNTFITPHNTLSTQWIQRSFTYTKPLQLLDELGFKSACKGFYFTAWLLFFKMVCFEKLCGMSRNVRRN